MQSEDVSEAIAIRASTLLFQILEDAKEYAQGIAWADKLATRFADNNRLSEEMLLAQAHFLVLQKNMAAGRDILLPLSKSRLVSGRAKFMLAETYYAEGDLPRALDYFRQITQKQDAASWLKAPSTIATFAPCAAARRDAATPPEPAPRVIMS